MTRRKRPPAKERASVRPPLPAVALLLALAVALPLLAVAPRAEAPFDSPKRLAATAGLAVAAATWLLTGGRLSPLAGRLPRAAAALLALGAAASVLSTALSPRPAAAWDALRLGALLALALLLGASRDLGAGRSALAGAALVAAASANALVALATRAGFRPFDLVARLHAEGLAAGAFLGNEGLLGLLLALAAPVAFVLALRSPRRATRLGFAAVLLLLLAALVSVRSVTGLVANCAAAGVTALATPRLRRAALLALAVVLLAAVAVTPARGRLMTLARELRGRELATVLTYRAGPWAAAVEMVRERPLAGFGPGTFGAEFYPHRLAAEARLGRRLTTPVPQSSYAEAHSDPLQAAAELGLPAALAFLAAALLVASRLARRAAEDPEAAALLGLLVAAGVASLSWFPLHRPELALPILAALGRGLALGATTEPT